MPTAPVPPEVVAFLRQPNPAVVASLRADGSPHTAATWYDWEEDGHVLLNMDESRRRLDFMRRDPRVTLTALGREDWGRYVTLFGRIVRIESDCGPRGHRSSRDPLRRRAVQDTGRPALQRMDGG